MPFTTKRRNTRSKFRKSVRSSAAYGLSAASSAAHEPHTRPGRRTGSAREHAAARGLMTIAIARPGETPHRLGNRLLTYTSMLS